MPQIQIKDCIFEVVRYTAEGHREYLDFLQSLAKDKTRPMQRFLARLEGVTGQDRTDAIHAFLARKDWDAPTQEEIEAEAWGRPAVTKLASLLLHPRLPIADLAELIDEDWQQVQQDMYNALRPPTDAEIIARNQAIKDRIKKQAQQEETPCPKTSTAPPQ